MKHRKTKSRITRIDLDAVLKLQREHTALEQRLNRLIEYAIARSKGITTFFMKGDDGIDDVACCIDIMANRIKELEDGKSRETSPQSGN